MRSRNGLFKKVENEVRIDIDDSYLLSLLFTRSRLRYYGYRVHFNSKKRGLVKIRQIMTFLTVSK